ncbi:hypothetical protein MYCTH_2307186 [Thermothelomyces thermophilus ATCC 42464]|uniref:VWFA domain-containing protein n=1 Tax=Thermothelomyces thermophilus (strain ATCC 42464 / BCRC 31852 / DSM 1799) TaxID=573729 RepID=G2QFC7_THET4|nr:uncharacterized protein MYCTH_2307186 [Thermothelomyces thermophilus ATCC 42464]AEO59156.1 hypothetical protein MYCTH_2307186 [Thermothelomyces thermophilus ATCC 42464]
MATGCYMLAALRLRTKFTLPVGLTKESQAPQVQLHPFKSDDERGGLIVKVRPPKEPANREPHHVPCDIVLCIDVSSSMNAAAPAPATSDGDQDCLSSLEGVVTGGGLTRDPETGLVNGFSTLKGTRAKLLTREQRRDVASLCT